LSQPAEKNAHLPGKSKTVKMIDIIPAIDAAIFLADGSACAGTDM
jgi:hypothetical protein